MTITIYTDGACSGNPGPGGWGALLQSGEHEKEIYGGEFETTNNRMEMMAVIKAIEALKKPNSSVDLYTDSTYVQQGITQWIKGWKAKNWPKKIKNQDLWKHMDALTENHDIRFHWIKGHAGHPGNERADELARMGIPK